VPAAKAEGPLSVQSNDFRRDARQRTSCVAASSTCTNVTTIIADQNHDQHVGIEHIAIETDDYAGALANFKKNGAQILEERVNNGRHVCWVAAPDGAQMELIEKV
jgi:hypothetical protein